MSRSLVVLGDPTTHGGVVISATSTCFIEGKPVALTGDLVSCPIPGHGITPILEGGPDWFENDRALVVDGCLAGCGCLVIATHHDCSVL